MNNKKSAFSIIEILIGIFVFSLGITSVYAIISSTLRVNDYNENYIIASNIAREQLELVRNIRDSNYIKIKPYNLKNPNGNSFNSDDKFSTGSYYKIENDYDLPVDFSIKLDDITIGFEEGLDKINGVSMQGYRICIDTENRYIYCTGGADELKTIFYRYISIDEVKFNNLGTTEIIDNSFLLKSKVIWYKKGYHEFEVKSIITDWKRL